MVSRRLQQEPRRWLMAEYKVTIDYNISVIVKSINAVMVMVGERLDKGISKIIIEEVKDEKDTKRGYTGRFSPW
jgi:hypothetical protein